MRLLIIGGAGYIGSVLCHQALDRSCQVTCVDSLEYDQGHTQAHMLGNYRYKFIRSDALDTAAYRPDLSRADAVINLAAIVGAPACEMQVERSRSINSAFVKDLVKALSPKQYLIYPNTNSGYGTVPEGVCTEDTPLSPVSLYGWTKLEGEEYALDHPLSTVYRLATVFGVSPRMRLDLLVNTLAWEAYFNKEVRVFDGDARRNYIHVADVAKVMIDGLTNAQMQQQRYNLGNDSINMTKMQLAQAVAQAYGAQVVKGAGSDPDKRDYLVSSQKLLNRMPLRLTSLAAGLDELRTWFHMLPQDRAARLAVWNQMRNF